MNTELKTIDIHGKAYVPVNARIKEFRENTEYKGWSLETEIVEITAQRCLMKTLIKDESGRIRSTGIAYEEHGTSNVNKTSYVENCETSAIGRALGMIGIGIENSIATAEEVKNAVKQQDTIQTVDDPMEIPNLAKERSRKCPKCNSELKLRVAKTGKNAGNEFYGCSSYPECKYTEQIKNKGTLPQVPDEDIPF